MVCTVNTERENKHKKVTQVHSCEDVFTHTVVKNSLGPITLWGNRDVRLSRPKTYVCTFLKLALLLDYFCPSFAEWRASSVDLVHCPKLSQAKSMPISTCLPTAIREPFVAE